MESPLCISPCLRATAATAGEASRWPRSLVLPFGLVPKLRRPPAPPPRWRRSRRRASGEQRGDQWAPLVGWSNLLTVLVILTMSLLQVLKREVAPLCTLGVILANFITKGLKILVKCLDSTGTLWRRPSNSRRAPEDPGFPSSHTSIMTFISVYFALYLWLHLGYPFFRAALVAVLPSGFMAAARIRDQDHTLQQTIGGVLWGTCMGLWWALIGPRLRGILEWAEPQPWALVVLCFAVAPNQRPVRLGDFAGRGPTVDPVHGPDSPS
ncbi:unnamed protein product [Durusdinium trenchii]|uniref:Phosphatidic acid phosphatase type 2/haloperoxidase domain-containing protein n=1 Tax=Durusdinium trenchii TaxID=1381693 RepID=A0ABP0SW67_9DINO